MAKKASTQPSTPASPAPQDETRVIVRPIDLTAKGSAAEWRDLNAVRVRLMRAQKALGESEEAMLEYFDAVAARDAIVKARAYTSDGSPLDAAWEQISQVDLNTLYYDLLLGGSTAVPPASETT